MHVYRISMEGITLLGDSQVKRMLNTLDRQCPKNNLSSHFAVSGLFTNELKSAVRQRVQTFHQVCFILISINDIIKRFPIKTIKNNLSATVKILLTNNRTVLISTLPPVLNSLKIVNDSIVAINVFILSLQTHNKVTVIKLHKNFPPFKPLDPRLFQRRYSDNRPDNVHLSAQGHRLLTTLINDATSTMGDQRMKTATANPFTQTTTTCKVLLDEGTTDEDRTLGLRSPARDQ